MDGKYPDEDYSQYGMDSHMDGMTVFDSIGSNDSSAHGLDNLMDDHMIPAKPATSPAPYTAGIPTPVSQSATPDTATAAAGAPPMPAGFPPPFCENGMHVHVQNGGGNGDTTQGQNNPAHNMHDKNNSIHQSAMHGIQHPYTQYQNPPEQQLLVNLLHHLPPAFANNPHAQALLQQNPLLLYQLVQMQQAATVQGGQNGQPFDTHLPSDQTDTDSGARRCPNEHQHAPSHTNTLNSATNTTNTTTAVTSTTANVSPNTASAFLPTAATAATPDDLHLQGLSIVSATHTHACPVQGQCQSTSTRHGPGSAPLASSTPTTTGPQSASSTTSQPPLAAGPPQTYMNHSLPPHHSSRSASSPIHNSSHTHSHPHSVPLVPPVPTLPPQYQHNQHHLHQQIPLPPTPRHPFSSHTLSPKKQRAPPATASAATSPKKPGRLESFYATIRKATTMRRSRTAFMNEAPPPTVAPMALMRDIGNTAKNHTIMANSKAHAHFRSHHPGDLDLDLSVANSFPITPPLTANASSLSSTSSSASASSSLASSLDAQSQLHSHSLLMQPTPINFGISQSADGDDGMTATDLAAFGMSGIVVDDPFVDSSAFFGGGQPIKADVGNSACWLDSTAMATTPGSMDDNESTPVSSATTAAINIPGARGMVSPTACLADATATLSGNSLIAAANAAAMLTPGQQNSIFKRDGSTMDTDEDWWQQSVVDSAVGDANGLPYFDDSNAMLMHGMDVNAAPDGGFYPMPDMATQGLMIHMPPTGDFQQQQQQQQNQYYFPNLTAAAGFGSVPMMATHSAPQYSMPPQPEMEFHRDRASHNQPRRHKPRAPSAGARHLQPGGSPRKRLDLSSRGPSTEDLNAAYVCSSTAGNVATMTTPNTPRSHAINGSRRSASMQSLSRVSPGPSNNSSMPSAPPMPATPSHSHGGVRKRRSASSMRRVSSGQSCGSMSGAPRTPMRRSSAEPARPHSSSSPSKPIGFVNFTPDDKHHLMAGVAPSGSSKTKERRDRELKEKTRKLMEAVVQAGGDVHTLEAQGLREIGINM